MKRKLYGQPVPIRIDKNILAEFEKVAERMGVSRNDVMRMAMRLGLDALKRAELSPQEVRSLLGHPESSPSGSDPRYPNPHPQFTEDAPPKKKNNAA